jgi:hypothetical protein
LAETAAATRIAQLTAWSEHPGSFLRTEIMFQSR